MIKKIAHTKQWINIKFINLPIYIYVCYICVILMCVHVVCTCGPLVMKYRCCNKKKEEEEITRYICKNINSGNTSVQHDETQKWKEELTYRNQLTRVKKKKQDEELLSDRPLTDDR